MAEPVSPPSSPLRAMEILNWDHVDLEPTTGGDFVAFNILVHANLPLHLRSSGHDAYVVRRRFRQFAKLHQRLVALGFELPDLPKVDVITNIRIKLSPHDALVERQDQLQRVLDTINSSREMQDTAAFTAFIGEPPHAKAGYTSFSEYSGQSPTTTGEPLLTGRLKSASLPW
ncbi:hypothetical protein LEN26_007154 [Aphanomyces euteiches]|nr:hypothetical protein AeMF1_012609 [Aphanomyces euteiches]KAH9133129.1 hypothetical protein LEN26_007154 [Aphanomyces euteiches]KAH9187806.1 hypothetical protein AeNC1_010218 [Aphanomyces euteiches]